MKILRNDLAVLENDTHISKWVEQHNSLIHNKSLQAELKYYLRKDMSIVEVGAFIGDNTAFLKDLGKWVISFEPNPEAFECLEHNSQYWDNVTLANCAIGSKKGKVDINRNENVGASVCVQGSEIDVITLDSLKLDSMDFMILDCEGWELDVLEGAVETIKKFQPLMLIEINRVTLEKFGKKPQDILDFLNKLGYFCRNLYTNLPMEGEQYDILCFKSSYNG